MGEDPTKTDHGFEPLEAHRRTKPVLVLAQHPDERLLDRHEPIEGALELGRQAALFGGALDEPLVSRKHARIERRGSELVVVDLGSHNGTFVNASRIAAETRLENGDVIGLGQLLFVVSEAPPGFRAPSHPLLVGVSSAIGRVIERIAVVAARPVPVLIVGETGVGKELVARAIHEESGLSGELCAVNCGAVADGVLQSELFGHVRGAFSGAGAERPGLVSRAQGGSLFLDEIGDASPALQASLLRLLEQREYRPVGGDEPRTSDARFMAATHVDLWRAAEDGGFRTDLLGRLERWVIEVPPLRERREDILVLARAFAARFLNEPVPLARAFAVELLLHDWPRNVRELYGVVEEATAHHQEGELAAPPEWRRQPQAVRPHPKRRPSADELRRRYVELECNATALASDLGIGRATLYRWCRELGVDLGVVREEWLRR